MKWQGLLGGALLAVATAASGEAAAATTSTQTSDTAYLQGRCDQAEADAVATTVGYAGWLVQIGLATTTDPLPAAASTTTHETTTVTPTTSKPTKASEAQQAGLKGQLRTPAQQPVNVYALVSWIAQEAQDFLVLPAPTFLPVPEKGVYVDCSTLQTFVMQAPAQVQ